MSTNPQTELSPRSWRRWRPVDPHPDAPIALARRIQTPGKGLGLRGFCIHCDQWHSWHEVSRAEWEGGATFFCRLTLLPLRLLPVSDGTTAARWRKREAAKAAGRRP